MILPEPPPAALRLAIDANALVDNWRALDRLSGNARAAAAVKADGYGVGVRHVVPVLREAGCRDFLVAHWSEVAPLLELVPAANISVLHGPLNAEDVTYAKAVGVRPVINSLRQARLWIQGGGGLCDMMVDTGINRLGLPLEAVGDEAIGSLQVDVLMSHLASADEDVALNDLQQRRWMEAAAMVDHRRRSLANSAGIVLGSRFHGDLTRPGLSLYGGIPRAELKAHIRPVVRPQAQLMQVRSIGPGDGVGYNTTFISSKPMRIGTIAMGYADGYLRCWSGSGIFRSGASRVPVLGRVSMDMTIVDLTNVPDITEGDWLEADYDLPNAAVASGLSQYELLTLLGRRFSR